MKEFLLKTLAATIEFPCKALVAVAQRVSPFTIKNEYIKQVYRNNINLFRLHLALSILLLLAPVLFIFAYAFTLGVAVAIKDFIFEAADDLRYEFLAVYRPIVRGFKGGLPRD